jgi:hypothetical protein
VANIFIALDEALKSGRNIDETVRVELKVPALEKADRIANLKWHRETKFKKMTQDSLFFLAPDEGFFFHYNPKENYYLESNASFSFIIGEGPRVTNRHAHAYYREHAPYSFSPITHPKIGYTDINFMVLKRNKKVKMEKRWGGEAGNKIRTNIIGNPADFQDALRAAVRFNPEIKDYTFSDKKMKVSEYLQSGPEALESGGEHSLYYFADADRIKKVMQDGVIDDIVYFEKKSAKLNVKPGRFKNLYNAWGIVEVKIKGKEGFGEFRGSGVDFEGKVDASKIKLVDTNYEPYFKKEFEQPKNVDLSKYEKLFDSRWGGQNALKSWNNIIIARDDAEYEKFKSMQMPERFTRVRGKRKGQQTSKRFSYFDNAIQLTLNNHIVILLFKPKTTEEDLKMFAAAYWYEQMDLAHFNRSRYAQPDQKPIAEIAYDIIFNRKVPSSMAHSIIENTFGAEYYYNIVVSAYPPEVK